MSGYPQYPPQGHSPQPGYGQQPPQYPPQHSPYPQQMSGYPPPQGQYGQPPQGQYGAPPPQGQYGAPPQGQYGAPPQGQYGAPPQGQYGQPPPGQYGAPPPGGQYGAPPPGQYGAPPQGQYGAPPQGQYGAPPQGQYGAPPPQGHYGGPPQGQYGAPPPQGQYGQPGYGSPAPQQPYGAPPPGQYPPQGQYGQPAYPTPPTFGYVPSQLPNIPSDAEVTAVAKAMKGFGTNEKELIRVLSKPDPAKMNSIRLQYSAKYKKDLVTEIKKEVSGYFEQGLVAIVWGPLTHECHMLYKAMKGFGTKETVLDDVLLGRSNADMNAIKAEYQTLFHKSLEGDLRGDLSGATEQMYMMVVSARRNEDSVPVIQQQIDQDVTELQRSIGNAMNKDAVLVCQILTSRNDAQIKAIAQTYHHKFGKTLSSVIKGRFSGHMEDALLLIVARSMDRPTSDAEQLEATMAGMGTKDILLVDRVVRLHWNRQYMDQVEAAYRAKYKTTLINRVKGETRGDVERLLVALIE